jgi:protease-4
MKDFFKNVFATVVGIALFFAIVGFFGFISIIGMLASGDSAVKVKDNSVLVLNLKGALQERAEDDIMAQVMGEVNGASIGLDDILEAISKAKDNDNVKGIYIESGVFGSDSPASNHAIREALLDFKKSGKWIVAYGDQYIQSAYYICSAADQVWINPLGEIDWHGLGSTPYYLKDVMAKFGVKVQLTKVGTYKSAPETFTSDHMSDANREQVTEYITGIWDQMLTDVSASRKISKELLNAYADSITMFSTTADYQKQKLIDKALYYDQVKPEIRKLLKIDADKDINTIGISQMLATKGKKDKGEEVAVYYAYGNIVSQQVENQIMGGGHAIVGPDVAEDLEKLAKDDKVKAVVLRINSGGGSAYASEQIWRAVTRLKEKKPVVVSMGGMAASGGYYMSCAANWIVAEPTTLTGSIGIFGMFPDFSGLLTEKLGVKFDEVKTNKNTTFGTMARPFNAEEMAILDKYIQRGYELFRKRVADGRKQPVEAIEKIAQGHVWLGKDALGNKLVDQLGNLDDAVKKAAELAKLKEHHTKAYPAMPSWQEQLLNQATGKGGSYLDRELRLTLGEFYAPFMQLRTISQQDAIQARIPFEPNIK